MFWTSLLTFTLIFSTATAGVNPRLAVVVSLDQYRGDYLEKFKRFSGERGFARAVKEGVVFNKCMYDHGNTATGPGHATLLTGSNPHRHGVTANTFCEAESGKKWYCAADEAGVIAPTPLEVATVGDLLRAKDARSKVIGVSAKDRSAVLMAGHEPTAVVWIDKETHTFTTSSYYSTPRWLDSIQHRYSLDRFEGKTWNGVIAESAQPAEDDAEWEGTMSSGRRTFPYTIPQKNDKGFWADVIRSPFGVSAVFEAALDITRTEELGSDDFPDVLCIGISSTDYLGHTFGPDSREVQEMYVEVDRWIGTLIDELDASVGRSEYVLIITSDHGIAPIPEMLHADRLPGRPALDAGRSKLSAIANALDSVLNVKFGMPSDSSWVTLIDEPSIFFSAGAIAECGVTRTSVVDAAESFLRTHPGIAIVARRDRMLLGDCPDDIPTSVCRILRNGFHASRSGDLLFYPKQNWILGADFTSHGSLNDYDRWVPLVLFGGGLEPYISKAPVTPADIAPTLALWWNITIPACDGVPLPIKVQR